MLPGDAEALPPVGAADRLLHGSRGGGWAAFTTPSTKLDIVDAFGANCRRLVSPDGFIMRRMTWRRGNRRRIV